MPLLAALWVVALSGSARACSVALLLSIDVSNSIDPAEWRIQADGLSEALRDSTVRDALVQGAVALSVVQWSGRGRQEVTIPWTRIRTDADVLTLSDRTRIMQRAFVMSDTAVGDMLRFATEQFDEVQDCRTRVIDVSGDGTDNAGSEVGPARQSAEARGIVINGLAIEGIGRAITTYYERHVVTRGGFVMTSRGHGTYAETLKRKIRREVSQILF